jgi:UDP-N-acetyl-D-glucosamine dehydrogenase
MTREKEGNPVKIAVMGQGYVGLPLAMAATEAGHTVVGYEPDKNRYDQLAAGRSYVEDIPDLRLMEAMAGLKGIYKPSNNQEDLDGFDVAVITVPTPVKRGAPDLSYIEAATTQLSLFLKPGATVILESTTFPGTTREVVVPILEAASELTAGQDFHVGFSPERIDPGNRDWHFGNTPKIVSGFSTNCLVWVDKFYREITDNVIIAESLEAAEMAKIVENTQRLINIAYVNELARHCRELNVDVHRVLELCETKPFGYTTYTPGPGVGGHCIPVDPVYLTHRLRSHYRTTFRMVELAQEINEGQPGWVARRMQDGLNKRGVAVNGARILALGAAYKPNTGDMRQSPAVEVIDLLREVGAEVTVVDPYFQDETKYQLKDIPTKGELIVHDYDAAVLLTPHSAFDPQHVVTHVDYVLDTRGVLEDGPNIERL